MLFRSLVGMIYERYHTRSIPNLGGIAARAPWLTVMFLLFTFSSIGLPGLNGFVGEFLILLGAFQRAWGGVAEAWRPVYLLMAVSAVAGVVLGAWYMLWAVERVFFGTSREPPSDHAHHATDGHDAHGHHAHEAHAPARDDLRWYEWAALAPPALFVLWIGLFPSSFLVPSAPVVRRLMEPGAAAFAARMGEAFPDTAATTAPVPLAVLRDPLP